MRKNSSGTIGLGLRASQATKATRVTAAATRKPIVYAEAQAWSLVSMSPQTSRKSPPVMRPTPGRSSVRLVGSRDSATAHTVTSAPTIPTGRLIQKTADQSTRSTSTPPSTGPIARASAEMPAQMPIAVPSSRRGKAATMIDSVSGFISAPPTPWPARKATSHSTLGASAQATDIAVKIPRPTRKSRLRPKRSPSLPPSMISTANEST